MNLNDRLPRLVIRKLTQARSKPPTVLGLLLTPTGLPLLFIVGVVSVGTLSALDLPVAVPLVMSGVILGAALRDFGLARKTVRMWPIHQEIYDWPKIDALAKQVAEIQGKSGKA